METVLREKRLRVGPSGGWTGGNVQAAVNLVDYFILMCAVEHNISLPGELLRACHSRGAPDFSRDAGEIMSGG
jgi:hypothetical protein